MGDAKDDLGDCFYGLGDRKNSRPNCKTAVWTRKKPPRGSPSHFAKQRYNKKSRNASGLFRPNPSQKRRQRGRVFQKQGRGSTLKQAGQQAVKSSSSQGERGREGATATILYSIRPTPYYILLLSGKVLRTGGWLKAIPNPTKAGLPVARGKRP